ncbi:MAG: CapA family protein [Ruminococcus sp.]|nr:CapA family protein [Ruminococcus sp.]
MKKLLSFLTFSVFALASVSCSSRIVPSANINTETEKIEENTIPIGELTVPPTEAPTEPTPVEITINFMGDCTLGTQHGADTPGRFNATADAQPAHYFFDGVREILEEGTFNITNCEGVLSDGPVTEAFKDYDPAFWFKSSAKNAKVFSENGIDLVGIANNHINDYNAQGRLDTIGALENNGVLWCDNTNDVVLEYEGIRIAVFCTTLWHPDAPNGICSRITEASANTDLQIVFFHGGTEYIHSPDSYKVQYAHSFVDAGADLVIGSHPHVLQPIEVYNGVNIVYSIGNFVYGGNSRPENRTVVYQHKFTFDDKVLVDSSEEVFPCYIYTGDVNEYQPTLIDDPEDKQLVLDFMYGKADSPL